ncbi:cyclic diguanylate phosphodiesterase, partial [Escherichia coli]|nr:cyclic diguanylate phosphodiesterase [Escherichia coli]
LSLILRYIYCLVFQGASSLDYLNQNNITFQQGYYFYKPVTYIDLVKIILSKPKVKVVVE